MGDKYYRASMFKPGERDRAVMLHLPYRDEEGNDIGSEHIISRSQARQLLDDLWCVMDALPDLCEGCDAHATTYDIEGVPLCGDCMDATIAENTKRTTPAPTGGD